MATSIRLNDTLVNEAKVAADVNMRSVPKQIEYWAKIGRIAEDNPDLTFEFIQGVLIGTAEMENGGGVIYERRPKAGS